MEPGKEPPSSGGAFKFAEFLKERLGATLDKEDEMDCLVAGANFLLRAIRYEAFTHLKGQKQFVQIDRNKLYPYLLVNIGSGVSMIKVLQAWCKLTRQLKKHDKNHKSKLGALGAFLRYDKHGLTTLTSHQCVERFPMGAPYAGGEINGPPIRDLNEKITWMDKFIKKGIEITAPTPTAVPTTTGLGGYGRPLSRALSLRSDSSAALNVGVLHFVPSLEVFPLLADPDKYEPNTVDLSDSVEREYWFNILANHLPDLVEKAVASEGATSDAKRRGDAFAQAFRAHLARLSEEPAAYGKLGLANIFEMREECLREFHFTDAYRAIKERVNEAALAVLPDLLSELDSKTPSDRILALIEGILAANIFDWGSKACLELYREGTIIEIYKMSRDKMQRPWRVDDFDLFKKRWIGEEGAITPKPYTRALLFVDNSGADIMLGMLPSARELLRRGTEVVLVANSLPAINDLVAAELPAIIAAAAKHCDILRKAAEAGGLLFGLPSTSDNHSQECQNGSVPPLFVAANGSGSPCIDFRQFSFLFDIANSYWLELSVQLQIIVCN